MINYKNHKIAVLKALPLERETFEINMQPSRLYESFNCVCNAQGGSQGGSQGSFHGGGQSSAMHLLERFYDNQF